MSPINTKIEYCFFKDLERIVFMSLVAVKTMRFLLPSENLQILFWIAHMCLLSLNIVSKVSLFDISHGKSAQMVKEIIEL